MTWPTGLTAVKGDKLSTVALPAANDGGTPGKFSWEKGSTTLNESGKHSVKFTPTDTETYNTVKEDVLVSVALEEIEMEMLLIPAGSFKMGRGSPDEVQTDSTWVYANEKPQHGVTLTKAFYMGRYEVTQAQWYAVMGTTIDEQAKLWWPDVTTTNWGSGDNFPMYCVSWFEALVFCNKLSVLHGLTPAYKILEYTDPAEWKTMPDKTTHENYAAWNAVVIVDGSNGYRLPTEAQWEYACRAGTTTDYYLPGTPSGDTQVSGNIGWYTSNSGTRSHEVGTKHANMVPLSGIGLYDMAGNVNEWCWDRMGAYTGTATSNANDPMGATTGDARVFRGGGWNSNIAGLRSAFRGFVSNFQPQTAPDTASTANPHQRSFVVGFRVVRPAE